MIDPFLPAYQSPDYRKTAQAIIQAMAGLCNELDVDLLAEGIETEEQLSALSEAGCIEIQGYMCGWPLPATSVSKVLEDAPELLERLMAVAHQPLTSRSKGVRLKRHRRHR